jgi:hypothetical protein
MVRNWFENGRLRQCPATENVAILVDAGDHNTCKFLPGNPARVGGYCDMAASLEMLPGHIQIPYQLRHACGPQVEAWNFAFVYDFVLPQTQETSRMLLWKCGTLCAVGAQTHCHMIFQSGILSVAHCRLIGHRVCGVIALVWGLVSLLFAWGCFFF